MPETPTAATAGAGAAAADLNRPAGRVLRRWWRRAGAALLIVMLLATGTAIYGAYGYTPPSRDGPTTLPT